MNYRYIPAPCPAYDITAMQNWLQNMHQQGWQLTHFAPGGALFARCTPAAAKYLILPSAEPLGLLSPKGTTPSEEEVAAAAANGWDYVTRKDQYFVFCSTSQDNTPITPEKEKKAISLSRLKKECRTTLIVTIFWSIICPLFIIRGNLIMLAAEISTPALLAILLLIVCGLVFLYKKVRYYVKAVKQAQNGCPLKSSTNTKWYLRQKIAAGVLVVACLACALAHVALRPTQQPFNYADTLPFANMEQLYQGEFLPLEGAKNTVFVQNSDPVVRQYITLSQAGSVTNDQGKFSGGLHVSYYKLSSSTLAKWTAKELVRFELLQNPFDIPQKQEIQISGADYAVVCESIFPVLIVQKGDIAIRVMFYFSAPSPYTNQQVMQKIVDAL